MPDGRILSERDHTWLHEFKRRGPYVLHEAAKTRPPKPQIRSGVNVLNDDSGQTVPPWGCMAVSGFEMDQGFPTLKIVKPSSTFRWLHIFNDGTELTYQGRKRIHDQQFVKALYNTGTPAVDEGYGATPGQWYLTKNYPEILRVGGVVDATDKIVYGKTIDLSIIIGELAGTLSQGSTATVNVFGGAGGSETWIGSALTLTARDYLMKSGATAIASGKDVICQRINGIVYVSEAECA